MAELKHGQNIWLVRAEDVADLANGISSLANDLQFRQKLSQGAGEIAALFSWENIADQTVAFFQSCINGEFA